MENNLTRQEADYWATAGLLHDIDFELYLEQHCLKAPELLREGGASDGKDSFCGGRAHRTDRCGGAHASF